MAEAVPVAESDGGDGSGVGGGAERSRHDGVAGLAAAPTSLVKGVDLSPWLFDLVSLNTRLCARETFI